MTCRTGLVLLVLTFGLGTAGIAAAQGAPGDPPPAPEAPAAGEEKPDEAKPDDKKPDEKPDEAKPDEKKPDEPDKPDEPPPPPPPPPPPTDPPPAPPPQPPPAPPPAGTGAAGASSPPGTFATMSVVPGGDQPMDDSAALPPRVPWRGTAVTWVNSATTTAMGVGRDNFDGTGEAYTMVWLANLNYYLVDLDKWSVSVNTSPGFWVELTNNDITTTEREPQFLDLPLLGTYRRSLFSDGLWSTSAAYTSGFVFPTSPTSHDRGILLGTTNRISLSQGVPVLGKDSPALKAISISGYFRWGHRFSEATTAVNGDLDRTRQTPNGLTFLDDQLGGGILASDTLREGISLGFSEAAGGIPISAGVGFHFGQQFKPDVSNNGNCVVIDTGMACPEGNDAPTTSTFAGFTASVGVQPIPEMSIELGYASAASAFGAGTLGPDGRNRNDPFYSPSAEFSAAISLHPDAFYERLIGPKRAIAEGEKKRRAF